MAMPRRYVFPTLLRKIFHYGQTDDDPPHSFTQTFVLKTLNEAWFIQHDIFRIGVHDVASS